MDYVSGLSKESLLPLFSEYFPEKYPASATGDSTLASLTARPHGPVALSIILLVLALIGAVLTLLISYAAKVLLVLTAVEHVPDSAKDLDSGSGLRIFITSSIRKTLRHLRSEAGIFSPLRGLHVFVALCVATGLVRGAILAVLVKAVPGILVKTVPGVLARLFASVLSFALFARFALAYTHIIISKPQAGRSWVSRIRSVPWSLAKKTLHAITVQTLCSQIFTELGHAAARSGYPIFVLTVLSYIFLVLPSSLVLIRVQASLLPDDTAAIVPLDKTFGYRDGRFGLGLGKAWRSFDAESRSRIGRYLWRAISVGLLAYLSVVALFVACILV